MCIESDWECEIDLEVAIDSALDEFVPSFEKMWGLDSSEPPDRVTLEEWIDFLSLREAATRLVDAALAMRRTEGLQNREINLPAQLEYASSTECKRIRELLASLHRLAAPETDWGALEALVRTYYQPDQLRDNFFNISIQIEVCNRILPSLRAMTTRVRKLIPHLGESVPATVRPYLQRLARCFVAGMDPELALMARAVLEVAFAARRPPEYMRQALQVDDDVYIYLSDWLREAESEGLLSADALDAARRITRCGNEVAHRGFSPDNVDADAIMSDMGLVLGELLRPSAA